MGKINWVRVVLCGLVAGIVWSLLSMANMTFFGGDFQAAVPGSQLVKPKATFLALSSNVGMGIWAMWLYASFRPRYGPGPKTAVLVGVAWWSIGMMVNATWVVLGLVPYMTLLPLLVAALPAAVLAAVVGAWPYQE
ncbi:MAG TPA: hypothetical protein VM056_00860 [Terriglobales bacterium]|nr:hypothetical protein [Terriglobales bacterium]